MHIHNCSCECWEEHTLFRLLSKSASAVGGGCVVVRQVSDIQKCKMSQVDKPAYRVDNGRGDNVDHISEVIDFGYIQSRSRDELSERAQMDITTKERIQVSLRIHLDKARNRTKILP